VEVGPADGLQYCTQPGHTGEVVEAPSVRERRLAGELRTLRTTGGWHGKDVAARLGWSASKVSRIETGRIGIGADDLDRLLALYRVPGGHAEYLRRLAPHTRPRGWWDAYADTLSAGYANLIRLESGSRALRCWSAVVPHALLQTPDYARAVILSTWERPSPAEVSRRVQVCVRRQEVLDGTDGAALRLSAVIDESVLHRRPSAGDADPRQVLRGQLERLLSVGERPNVSVRVLPFSAGLPPVTSGSFAVLDSPVRPAADVVYLENKTRIFFLDGDDEVQRYEKAFEHIAGMALPVEESRAVLTAALERS
jgi:transcriptional regulator with XRE-family HTH domain